MAKWHSRLAIVVGLTYEGCAARALPIDGKPQGGDGASVGGGSGANGGGGSGASGGGGSGASGGGGSSGGGGNGPASPRLVAPLSTVTVSSRRPRLRWDMSGVVDGAAVDLCADRACAQPIGSATVDKS